MKLSAVFPSVVLSRGHAGRRVSAVLPGLVALVALSVLLVSLAVVVSVVVAGAGLVLYAVAVPVGFVGLFAVPFAVVRAVVAVVEG